MSGANFTVPIATNRLRASFVRGLDLYLRCPACFRPMTTLTLPGNRANSSCASCGFTLVEHNGIWKALPLEREERLRRFIEEYQEVRHQEGRWSSQARFYLLLPYRDLSARNAWQWKIRASSFRFLTRNVLPQIEREHSGGFKFLDVGAGNCWMSYRLALMAHRPVAVDLRVNDEDGLGAAKHYFPYLSRPFPRFQAEMDRLPFEAGQFDVIIFNAAFHYSENYERTLREALRCLRRPGHLLIVDSPFYDRDEDGQLMVEEHRREREAKFGFCSDSIPSQEYLTPQIFEDLARAGYQSWRALKPWLGVGWALRPWKARLLGRRKPSNFFILWATASER